MRPLTTIANGGSARRNNLKRGKALGIKPVEFQKKKGGFRERDRVQGKDAEGIAGLSAGVDIWSLRSSTPSVEPEHLKQILPDKNQHDANPREGPDPP